MSGRRVGIAILALVGTMSAAAPGTLRAQAASGSIGGVVRSPGGEPVVSADVVIDAARRQTRTDDRGEWRLDVLPLGTHRVVIRRVGYLPVERSVALTTAGQRVMLVDTLRAQAVRLEPVVVSARRSALPGTFNRLESGASVAVFAEEIDAIPTNLYDVNALIARVPRLQAYNRFSRGVPFCNALNGQAAFVDGVLAPRMIPIREWIGPYDIEVFEITRGPAAIGDEARRRAAGEATGPKLDPRISMCPWVWMFWTRDYVRRAGP